jgi:hypothetical protein
MLRINQFNLEPGVYDCSGVKVVVTEIITHQDGDQLVELEDPFVVYRDLEPKIIVQNTMMKLSLFKTKYKKV